MGEHSTGSKEEAIVILQGKGEISFEGKGAIALEEKTLVYVPPEITHDVKNTGAELLRYIYVVAPVSHKHE